MGRRLRGEEERAGTARPWSTSPRGRMHLRDVETGGMALAVAEVILREMNVDRPWYTVESFVEALAALSAVHRGDMTRKTCQAPCTLR